MKSYLFCFIALLVTGCASLPEVPLPPFPLAEYEALPKEGTGIVSGQVFLRTVSGDVKYGAGSAVHLTPATSYMQFMYANEGTSRPPEGAKADGRLKKYSYTTQADGGGNFRFENIPPGRYFLISDVTWNIDINPGPIPVYSKQGGTIMVPLTVSNGKEIKQHITR